ncbi:MAG: hypothetical protein QNK11_04925 [Legionella sp.]|nr:hypothetical protein [Legionella sp.]
MADIKAETNFDENDDQSSLEQGATVKLNTAKQTLEEMQQELKTADEVVKLEDAKFKNKMIQHFAELKQIKNDIQNVPEGDPAGDGDFWGLCNNIQEKLESLFETVSQPLKTPSQAEAEKHVEKLLEDFDALANMRCKALEAKGLMKYYYQFCEKVSVICTAIKTFFNKTFRAAKESPEVAHLNQVNAKIASLWTRLDKLKKLGKDNMDFDGLVQATFELDQASDEFMNDSDKIGDLKDEAVEGMKKGIEELRAQIALVYQNSTNSPGTLDVQVRLKKQEAALAKSPSIFDEDPKKATGGQGMWARLFGGSKKQEPGQELEDTHRKKPD